MNDTPEEVLTFWQQHRFLLLIISTITTSIILVGISLTIYKMSGAAQLDLSRPGYIKVSKQTVNNDKGFEDYSAIGAINQKTINEFKQLYDKQVKTTNSVDAFGGDPLNPDTLEFAQAQAPTQ